MPPQRHPLRALVKARARVAIRARNLDEGLPHLNLQPYAISDQFSIYQSKKQLQMGLFLARPLGSSQLAFFGARLRWGFVVFGIRCRSSWFDWGRSFCRFQLLSGYPFFRVGLCNSVSFCFFNSRFDHFVCPRLRSQSRGGGRVLARRAPLDHAHLFLSIRMAKAAALVEAALEAVMEV